MQEGFRWVVVLLVVVVPIMKIVSEKTAGNSWWSSFSAELFAALISLAIASFLIPRYLESRKKPVFEVVNKVTSKPELELNISEDKSNYNGVFKLGVWNKTNTSYRDVYWHLYIPSDFNPRFRDGDGRNREEIKGANGKVVCFKFSGQLKEPLYPYRRTTLVKELELTFQNGDNFDLNNSGIYYSFSTEYGVYPEGSKQKNVLLKEPDFGKIKIVLTEL